eukprot:195991_1
MSKARMSLHKRKRASSFSQSFNYASSDNEHRPSVAHSIVVQGAITISKLRQAMARNPSDSALTSDLEDTIEEILQLVKMKSTHDTDPDAMARISQLVKLSKDPEYPEAEWILTDFFAQKRRTPPNPALRRIRARHQTSDQLHNAVIKVSAQQKAIAALKKLAVNSKSNVARKQCMSDPITKYFNAYREEWDFDIFIFEDICQKNGTSAFMALTHSILIPICNSLKFDTNMVMAYFTEIEAHYRSPLSVIYHNALHAADVLYNMWYFLRSQYFENQIQLSDIEIFSGLMAALVHDVDHPGTNNSYHIDSSAPLAIRYNDKSVLENHHVSLAFHLLSAEERNFLASSEVSLQKRIRKIVIQSVLGTDMVKHSMQINRLQSCIKHIQHQTKDKEQIDLGTKHEMIEIALHIADISNPAKRFAIASVWAYKISEEFFRQGDLQKVENLDVLPLFDRAKTKVHQSQIGFIEYVVKPVFKIWTTIIVELDHTIDEMNLSLKSWEQQKSELSSPRASNPALHDVHGSHMH